MKDLEDYKNRYFSSKRIVNFNCYRTVDEESKIVSGRENFEPFLNNLRNALLREVKGGIEA